MNNNLNPECLDGVSQEAESSPREEKSTVIEENKGLTPEENDSPAGRMVEENAVTLSQDDGSSHKKATSSANLVRCEVCLCEMSSDLVWTSHMNGSRHKKRMKALEIVANLKATGEKGIGLEINNGSNSYRCELCSLTVNSPQQLEIHLAGARHKNRMAKERTVNIMVSVTTTNSRAKNIYDVPGGPPLKKRKKEGRVLYCDVCNVVLNSTTQYEQHVLSKKHLGRAKGEITRKKRVNRIDKPTLMESFIPGSRFYSNSDPEGNSFQTDGLNQSFSTNNRIIQAPSQQHNRSNLDYNAIGTNNVSPFGNYYQPRPLFKNHRNNFGRISEVGKFMSKSKPHSFNSHTDSVLKSPNFDS